MTMTSRFLSHLLLLLLAASNFTLGAKTGKGNKKEEVKEPPKAPEGKKEPTACEKLYTGILEKAPSSKPGDIGKLYGEWCKKNMQVGSSKSLDELCAPMVKKVAEKMSWVPPETDVTPPLVCGSVDQIKAQFPEYASKAEELLKRESDKGADQKKILEAAKGLKGKLSTAVTSTLKAWEGNLLKAIEENLQAEISKALGGGATADLPPSAKESAEKLVTKPLVEAATLQSRGMGTKLLQKLEESVGAWANKVSKEAKAKAEL
eukprot:TRINITY_DN18991_c0_g1_i1.p1 TRINITY_DN18991_c0_g1~~TRINITY_DN18991_c0_g1_i1.p1  ORF type:complete len:262 (-),score=79.11 TRINITY_DN18991_c0_g1_i1:218-1003(-)